ncbi:MAG: glycosyltransferase [Candidatus Melainabacteria bacterium]|nr:glycosyltransferase [Candidatus Melainabacteria bacterium]
MMRHTLLQLPPAQQMAFYTLLLTTSSAKLSATSPSPPPKAPEHLLIVTDAMPGMLNGVVTRMSEIQHRLQAQGHKVSVLTPEGFPSLPLHFIYPGLRLTLPMGFSKRFQQLKPSRMVIMNEMTLGLGARFYALRHRLPYATAYTTNYCDVTTNYDWLQGVPKPWTDWMINTYLRWFHRRSDALLVNSNSSRNELLAQGYPARPMVTLGGAVDTERFHPSLRDESWLADCPRPFWLYVGRVSREKRLDEFLDLSLPGTKIVVGDGPDLERLQRQFGNHSVRFLGRVVNAQLAKVYASCDVFVFPSEFETLGRVLLEALASGLPVAAKPVRGPIDVIHNNTACGTVGVLSRNLQHAALEAWALVDPAATSSNPTEATLRRKTIARYAATYFGWQDYLPRFLYSVPRLKARPRCRVMKHFHWAWVTLQDVPLISRRWSRFLLRRWQTRWRIQARQFLPT